MNEATIDELHRRLIRETFRRGLTDSDAFLIFVLFHSYRIVLSGPVLNDRPNVQEVEPLTQRSVSEALAAYWAGATDERSNYLYWYHRWNGEWGGYSHAENLSLVERERLEQLRAALEQRYALAVVCTSARFAVRSTLPNCVPFRAGEFGFTSDCVAQCENVLSIDTGQLDLSAGPVGTLDDIAHREVIKAIGYVMESDCEPL